ncbi:MAG: branched-chain amino acid ABC transporter permease, partial [Burkholderiaceae bacterium]
TSAWLMWPAAALAGGVVAALIGLVALRTRGVYFIMTTLAFAQMLYFVAVSLRKYGGDDGYTLMARPALGLGIDLGNETNFYLVVLVVVALLLAWLQRATRSRFGHALMGIRDNETRMRALGYPVFRLQLAAFAIAGAIAGLAGALLAGGNGFISPATMHWTQSATLLVMVVIGGLGRSWGGPVGAVVWLVLEETLKQSTEHWHLPLGLLLIAVALWAPRGLAALSRTRKAAA